MTKKKTPKLGRPTKQSADRREKLVQCRLSDSEREKVELAASASGKSLSDWLRETILDAAKRDGK